MPTVIDLGQAQKKAHPGAYDDIDDAALGRAVQTKYPGQYDDFTNVNTGVRMGPAPPVAMPFGQQSPASVPNYLDRVSTEMNQGGAMLDPKQVLKGIGSSLGRTTQAWSDMFTGRAGPQTAAEMVPIVGPMAVDATRKILTPGQRIEGLTDAGLMLAGDRLAPGARDILPGYNEGNLNVLPPDATSYATARARGAAATAGSTTRNVGTGVTAAAPDVGRGLAKIGGGVGLGWLESKLPLPGPVITGLELGGAPIMYRGGRQVLQGLGEGVEAFRDAQYGPVLGPELRPKGYKAPRPIKATKPGPIPPTPEYNPSGPENLYSRQAPARMEPVQYPADPKAGLPVDPTSIPPPPAPPPPPYTDTSGQYQYAPGGAAPPVVAPKIIPVGYDPDAGMTREPIRPVTPETPGPVYKAPFEPKTVAREAPVKYPAGVNYDPTAGQVREPIVSISGKPQNATTETIPGVSVSAQSGSPVTPAEETLAPDITSPLEQAQARQTHLESSGQAVPGTKILKVIPGEANTQAEIAQRADGQYAVVHRDMDSGEVVSTTITPDIKKAEAIANSIQIPGLPPDLGTGTENTSGLLKNLTEVVKKSSDKNAERIAENAGTIGHNLTVDKNQVIAEHLADNNITRTQWEALSQAQKNDWIKKVNKAQGTSYKKLGADYDPSPNPRRFGRSAEVGASDIADALDRAWAKKKSSGTGPITPIQPPALEPVGLPVATPKLPVAPTPAVAPPPETPRPFLGAKRPPAVPEIAALADQYNATQGKPAITHAAYEAPSSYFARYTADAYDNLKADNSADPTVRGAYDALAKEVNAQWDFAQSHGITMEPWTKTGQPYANSAEMVNDLAKNQHLYFFQGGEPHPLLGDIDPETGLSANDKFRAVHDIFGHAAGGFGFGPTGEEAAYRAHSQMFSPEAARAMATETRGQNSWVNFGKQNYEGDIRRNIPLPDRPYAQQKADLLPPEFIPPDAQARRVSFGLDTGEGTPFRHEGITTINPKTADWVVRQAAAKYGVGIMSEDIGGGAYQKSTEPAMHVEIVGAPKNILDFMTAGGHALQQTEVIGTRALKAGKSYAFDIIQKAGKDLASDATRNTLFHDLRAELGDDADLVPGYQSVEKNGQPGIRVLKFNERMTPEETAKIEAATDRATANKYTVKTNHFPVDLLSTLNDWRVNPNGEEYTRRLTGSGQGPGRLMDDQFWRSLGSRIEADRAAGLTGQPAGGGKPPGH